MRLRKPKSALIMLTLYTIGLLMLATFGLIAGKLSLSPYRRP